MTPAFGPRSKGFPPFLVALGLAISLLAGCGKPTEELSLVPVSGKVYFNKAPLPMGQVNFYPDAAKGNKGNRVPSGLLNADGTYTIATGVEGGQKEGAPPGWYKVTITPTGASDPSQAKLKIPQYNLDFQNEKNTSLTVEVKAGADPKSYEFTVRP